MGEVSDRQRVRGKRPVLVVEGDGAQGSAILSNEVVNLTSISTDSCVGEVGKVFEFEKAQLPRAVRGTSAMGVENIRRTTRVSAVAAAYCSDSPLRREPLACKMRSTGTIPSHPAEMWTLRRLISFGRAFVNMPASRQCGACRELSSHTSLERHRAIFITFRSVDS